ncbi:hypothetical protein L3Q82_004476 [Scortum barcoo]|uniref:Uncharacterized protein n=1 Tax=Scortum barcoo TaxID=214431 RepID=A0ACB8VKI3_9TELE|nr:hypothetical protein L3Q82_004476 [Scortum barcoo]
MLRATTGIQPRQPHCLRGDPCLCWSPFERSRFLIGRPSYRRRPPVRRYNSSPPGTSLVERVGGHGTKGLDYDKDSTAVLNARPVASGLFCSHTGLCCLRSCPGMFTDPTKTQLASLLRNQSLTNLHACLSQSLPSLSVNPTNPPPVRSITWATRTTADVPTSQPSLKSSTISDIVSPPPKYNALLCLFKNILTDIILITDKLILKLHNLRLPLRPQMMLTLSTPAQQGVESDNHNLTPPGKEPMSGCFSSRWGCETFPEQQQQQEAAFRLKIHIPFIVKRADKHKHWLTGAQRDVNKAWECDTPTVPVRVEYHLTVTCASKASTRSCVTRRQDAAAGAKPVLGFDPVYHGLLSVLRNKAMKGKRDVDAPAPAPAADSSIQLQVKCTYEISLHLVVMVAGPAALLGRKSRVRPIVNGKNDNNSRSSSSSSVEDFLLPFCGEYNPERH